MSFIEYVVCPTAQTNGQDVSDQQDPTRPIRPEMCDAVTASVREVGAAVQPDIPAPPGLDRDRLLGVKDVAEILGVSKCWIYRHKADLPFTRMLTASTLRFSQRGLYRWIESRRNERGAV